MRHLAAELEAGVAGERAGQQVRLAEDLEAVADAPHQAAGVGELGHLLHQRSEAGHGAGAQVVTVREAAGEDDAVGAAQPGVLVPEHHRLVAGELDGVGAVAIRPRAREDGDPEPHATDSTP